MAKLQSLSAYEILRHPFEALGYVVDAIKPARVWGLVDPQDVAFRMASSPGEKPVPRAARMKPEDVVAIGQMSEQGIVLVNAYRPKVIALEVPAGKWNDAQPLMAQADIHNLTTFGFAERLITATWAGRQESPLRGAALKQVVDEISDRKFGADTGYMYEREPGEPNRIVLKYKPFTAES